jgi:hypothetical protein
MSKRPRKESHEDEAETRRGSSIPRTPPKPLVRGLVPWSHSANSPARQRYLYLVLDDWERGYSIHRLGEGDFFESDAGLAARPSAAACPLVRVHAQDAYTCSFLDHVRLQDLGDASSGVQPRHPSVRHRDGDGGRVQAAPCRLGSWVRTCSSTRLPSSTGGDARVHGRHQVLHGRVSGGPAPPFADDDMLWSQVR